MHNLLAELMAMVPPDGSPWPQPARHRWVAAMGAVLDVLYEDGPLAPAGASSVLDLRPPGQDVGGGPRGRHARPGSTGD